MSYIKAQHILPVKLLKAVQKYIDGNYIYIPRKQGMRKPWGANTKSKYTTAYRNQQIMAAYLKGIPVKQLAQSNFITDKTVYKIIAHIKYNK